MNLLLDTHIIIWWLNDDEQLKSIHKKLIADPNNLCYISSASIWEISIKSSLGKLKIPSSYFEILKEQGFLELSINWFHCKEIKKLPDIHRDPFDRMLISQAKIEDMTLLTVDDNIKKYEINFL